jgi:hypothetical protein
VSWQRLARGERVVWLALVMALIIGWTTVAWAAGPSATTVDCDAVTVDVNADGTVTIPLHCRVSLPSSTPTTPAPTTTSPTTTSPTPSPTTMSPTPSPSTSSPTAPTWPGADNTGVPTGTALRLVNGDQTIRVAGTVIDGQDIRGCVRVEAARVTIRNSRITCPGGWAVNLVSGDVTVEAATISCGGGLGMGLVDGWPNGGQLTVRRTDISGCENGIHAWRDVTVESSWIHGLTCGRPGTPTNQLPHPDGIQIGDDSRNITIVGNRIDQNCPGQLGGTSAIIGDTGTHTDVTIERNWLTGNGSYTVYCALNPTRYVIRDNVIGRSGYGHWVNCGARAGLVNTGNVLA